MKLQKSLCSSATDGPKKPSLCHTNGADSILPAETLDNNTSCGSTHSTSISPTLQLVSGGARPPANGHPTTTAARLSWQPGPREAPRANTPAQAEEGRILSLLHRPPPPPVKPKPPYRSLLCSSSSPPPLPLPVSQMDSEKTQSSQSPPLPSTAAPSPLSSGGLSSPPSHPPCGTRKNYPWGPLAPPFFQSPQINGPLRRSFSDDLLSLLPPDPSSDASSSSQHARERLRLRFPSASRPRKMTIPTGSLPELATPTAALASPAVDEDNYTIPSRLLPLPPSSSPQPYLTPQSLYSYAYSHTVRTLASKYRSGAQGKSTPATAASKQRREKTPSNSSNPYESIKYCGKLGEAVQKGVVMEEPDYDEISDVEDTFMIEPERDATPTFGKTMPASSPHATPTCPPVGAEGVDRPASSTHNHTPFISRSQSYTLPGYTRSGPSQRMKLRPILSLPLPQAPVSRPRVSSTTSDGYVNEDEFPRPTTLPPSLPNHNPPLPNTSQPPTPLRYTKLHHSLIEEDSTYDVPLEHTPVDSTWAKPVYKYRQDYDHLEEGEEEEVEEGKGEKRGYDRLSSSRSSYS